MLIRPDLDFCGESLQFSLQLNLHKWLTLSQVFMFVLVLCVNYLVVVSQLREINKMLELYFPGSPFFLGIYASAGKIRHLCRNYKPLKRHSLTYAAREM